MKKILVAYDGSEAALKALDTAAALAKAMDASVAVVSVVPVFASGLGIGPWDDHETHANELAEARRLLQEKGVEAELLEPIGEPARTIERIAREGGFDTIVVGSRGLNFAERLLQGSVSEYVATHAQATVIVAR